MLLLFGEKEKKSPWYSPQTLLSVFGVRSATSQMPCVQMHASRREEDINIRTAVGLDRSVRFSKPD